MIRKKLRFWSSEIGESLVTYILNSVKPNVMLSNWAPQIVFQMSLSADVPPFVSGPVYHGGAPSQYPLPQAGGYLAASPQVATVPPVPASNTQGGYPHYMVNCYPYVSER